jgi:hypothetical protein
MRNRFCECSRAWLIALVMLAALYPLDVVFMAFSVHGFLVACLSYLLGPQQRTEVTPMSDR